MEHSSGFKNTTLLEFGPHTQLDDISIEAPT